MKMDVKCTHTCSQSVRREVTNCRMYEVDANWIIMLKWTLKVLACVTVSAGSEQRRFSGCSRRYNDHPCSKEAMRFSFFDVLLTVHLSIFIAVFNQLDAQNLFHNKFHYMPLHVSNTRARHQGVKIALHSLWYHHTYRWPSFAKDGHL